MKANTVTIKVIASPDGKYKIFIMRGRDIPDTNFWAVDSALDYTRHTSEQMYRVKNIDAARKKVKKIKELLKIELKDWNEHKKTGWSETIEFKV